MRFLVLVGLFAVAFADVSHLNKGNYDYPKPTEDVIGQQSAALNREYLPSVQAASSNNDEVVFVTIPTTAQPIIVSKPTALVKDNLTPVQINSLDVNPEVHTRFESTTAREVVITSSAPKITTSLPVTRTSVSSNSGYKYTTPGLVTGQGSVIVKKIVIPSTSAAPVIITGSPSTIAPVTSGPLVEISVKGSNDQHTEEGYKYPSGDPSLVAIPGQGSQWIGSESIGSSSTVVPSHTLGADGYKYKIPKVIFDYRKFVSNKNY